jgi:hypothetical protein
MESVFYENGRLDVCLLDQWFPLFSQRPLTGKSLVEGSKGHGTRSAQMNKKDRGRTFTKLRPILPAPKSQNESEQPNKSKILVLPN